MDSPLGSTLCDEVSEPDAPSHHLLSNAHHLILRAHVAHSNLTRVLAHVPAQVLLAHAAEGAVVGRLELRPIRLTIASGADDGLARRCSAVTNPVHERCQPLAYAVQNEPCGGLPYPERAVECHTGNPVRTGNLEVNCPDPSLQGQVARFDGRARLDAEVLPATPATGTASSCACSGTRSRFRSVGNASRHRENAPPQTTALRPLRLESTAQAAPGCCDLLESCSVLPWSSMLLLFMYLYAVDCKKCQLLRINY